MPSSYPILFATAGTLGGVISTMNTIGLANMASGSSAQHMFP